MKRIVLEKEQLYDLYIVQNLSVEEVAKRLNVSVKPIYDRLKLYEIKKDVKDIVRCREKTNIEQYGAKNPMYFEGVKDKMKETFMRNYGVDNPNKSDIVREKTKQTCLERYGVECVLKSEDVKDKIKNTMVTNYGVNNAMQVEEFKEKQKGTLLKHYGVDNPLKSEEIRNRVFETNIEKYGTKMATMTQETQDKIKETNLGKYGVPCVFQSEDIKKRIDQTCIKKYGYTRYSYAQMPAIARDVLSKKDNLLDYILKSEEKSVYWISQSLGVGISVVSNHISEWDLWSYIDSSTSRYEKEVRDFLLNHGIKCKKSRRIIPPKEIDMFCQDYNIGIEFNGNYWHSVDKVGKTYHKDKFEQAAQNGVFLYHFYEYEWDIKNQIYNNILSILNRTMVFNQKNYIIENGKVPDYLLINSGYVCKDTFEPTCIMAGKLQIYNAGYKYWEKK